MEIIELSWEDTIPIRHNVLWPNEAPEYCMVDGDEQALHFGIKKNDQLVCVASIYLERTSARLRKFATLNQFQGQGIGSFMLRHLIEKLKKKDVNYFWFDARESAMSFYNRLGFKSEGELFYKNEVSYFKMSAKI